MHTSLFNQALFYLGVFSKCDDLLQMCETLVQKSGSNIHIVINCPNNTVAASLSRQRQNLKAAANSIGWGKKIILKVNGEDFDIIPVVQNPLIAPGMIVASTENSISNPNDLFDLVRQSEVPTYVTLLPEKWEWNMPIEVALASVSVVHQVGRICFKYHGQDISRLYDKAEMERQTKILMQALDEKPDETITIKDLEYLSYGSDPTRTDLQKNCDEKYRYNADFQVMRLPGAGIVRICKCKERERVLQQI
jgi:hypothetical protein